MSARSGLRRRAQRWLGIEALQSDMESLRPEVQHLIHAMHNSYRWSNLTYSIESLRAVVGAHTFENPPLISVITPTHNRRPLLERAVASVRNQRYPNWEHVIVVDRCEDDTLDYVTRLAAEDGRVHFTVSDHGKCGAARNEAYGTANGSIIVYLDDDNQFDPLWMASAAWAFETYPDLQALYGVLVIDHQDRVTNYHAAGQLPEMMLHPFDRAALAHDNYVDIGTLAHRSDLPEARFDETLGIFDDWEMFGRVASATTPLALPALSVIYRTSAPDRLSLDFPGNPVAEDLRRRLSAILLPDPDGLLPDPPDRPS